MDFKKLNINESSKQMKLWTDNSEEYIKRSMVTGKTVMVNKGSEMIAAHVLGIDQEFGLKVRYEDGSVEVLRSGEISIRI